MTHARDAAFVAGCFGLILMGAFWCRHNEPNWLAVLS